jgi:AhpD family alkylhydroperoxidase
MDKDYPAYRRHLQSLVIRLNKEIPGTIGAFGQLHDKSLADGALPQKTKELMCVAIAVAGRCEGCIAYHVHDALRAGAAREEVLETIGVAVMMGGGPAAVYGCEALEALEQFEAARGT